MFRSWVSSLSRMLRVKTGLRFYHHSMCGCSTAQGSARDTTRILLLREYAMLVQCFPSLISKRIVPDSSISHWTLPDGALSAWDVDGDHPMAVSFQSRISNVSSQSASDPSAFEPSAGKEDVSWNIVFASGSEEFAVANA